MNEPYNWADQEGIPVIRPKEPHLLFHSGSMFPKSNKGWDSKSTELTFTGQTSQEANRFIRKGFSGVFGSRLDSVWSYKKWTETTPDKVFAFDLETIGGDKQIVEMAFQSKSGQTFHRFVKPNNIASVEELFERYKKDPMSIYRMNSTEQRSIADLVRYSTEGKNGFNRKRSTHNRVVDELFKGDSLYVHALSSNKYIKHMESGLQQVRGFDAPNVVAAELQQIMDPKNLYVGHNSRKFDIPILKQFMENNGQGWRGMTNHLDTYDLLKTVFPTMDKILKEKGKRGIRMGDQKLQTLVDMFSLESEAHSALGDTGEGGLLGVLDKLKPYVDDALNAAPFYEG
ncbi:exonuclease domain-containing protein, partial [Rhodococcus sp. IEGM1300]